MRLIILGPPGAGKGTQAVRISEHYDVAHFSTGDLFRELARIGTAFGLKAKEFMDAGELVNVGPTSVMVSRLSLGGTRSWPCAVSKQPPRSKSTASQIHQAQ